MTERRGSRRRRRLRSEKQPSTLVRFVDKPFALFTNIYGLLDNRKSSALPSLLT